jgi:hypothetical protein
MQRFVLLLFCWVALTMQGTLEAQNPKSPDLRIIRHLLMQFPKRTLLRF